MIACKERDGKDGEGGYGPAQHQAPPIPHNPLLKGQGHEIWFG